MNVDAGGREDSTAEIVRWDDGAWRGQSAGCEPRLPGQGLKTQGPCNSFSYYLENQLQHDISCFVKCSTL